MAAVGGPSRRTILVPQLERGLVRPMIQAPRVTPAAVVKATQKAQATALKQGGGGAPATAPRPSTQGYTAPGISIGGALAGAIGGFVTGGPVGAVTGGILGSLGGSSQPATNPALGSQLVSSCPSGFVRDASGQCVQAVPTPGVLGTIQRTLPGGATGTEPASYQATQGAFGLPAVEPVLISTVKRRCPKGLVLGTDELCYPKAVLSRRNKFRKWRQAPRPPVTAADMRAVRKLERIRDVARELGKAVDLKVQKK